MSDDQQLAPWDDPEVWAKKASAATDAANYWHDRAEAAERERDELRGDMAMTWEQTWKRLRAAEHDLATAREALEAAEKVLHEYDLWAEDANDGEFAIWSREEFMASFLVLRQRLAALRSLGEKP